MASIVPPEVFEPVELDGAEPRDVRRRPVRRRADRPLAASIALHGTLIVATFIALFVLFIVPVVLIVLFWMVHVLPERIAHKRHHPQFEAIRTLCLLSLVFGGLLWPLAWLWAYSKPVFYKAAYGTDKHPDAFKGGHALAATGPGSLHDRVAQLEDRVPAAELGVLRADLEALEAKFVEQEVR